MALNFRILISTFSLIFLAELGDKTQLATMMLAAQSKSPVSVFVGAAMALALTSLLGVMVGEFITDLVPARVIHSVAGVGFIVLGGLLLMGRL